VGEVVFLDQVGEVVYYFLLVLQVGVEVFQLVLQFVLDLEVEEVEN